VITYVGIKRNILDTTNLAVSNEGIDLISWNVVIRRIMNFLEIFFGISIVVSQFFDIPPELLQ